VLSLPTSSGTSDPSISEQSATLLAKLEAVMDELSNTKTTLGGDITGIRTQSQNETQQLKTAIEQLKHVLEKQSETPDQDVVALRSVSRPTEPEFRF
jgi:uncharacterized protein YoxC